MPLGIGRLNTLSRVTGAGGPPASGWTEFSSSAFALGKYSVTYNSMTLHGVVNTNQLVGTLIYTESDGGTLPYYVRGFVVDLSSGAINIGSAYSPFTSGTYAGARYLGAIAGNGNTGLLVGIATASYYVRVQGFTITNYSSCNQSTAPVISFGSSTDTFTNGNTLGVGLNCNYIGNNNRYVVTHRGNDLNRRRSFTWDGTTLAADSAYASAGSNGDAGNDAVFANPGSGLLYGAHHVTPDGNKNFVNAVSLSSNTTIQNRTDFFSAAVSAADASAYTINDVAGTNRSIVIGTHSTNGGWSARTLTTTDFTSTSATTWGTESKLADPGTDYTYRMAMHPTNSTDVLVFSHASGNTHVTELASSGTTLTWGTYKGFGDTIGSYSGFTATSDYKAYDNTSEKWYVNVVTNSSNSGIVRAYRYV